MWSHAPSSEMATHCCRARHTQIKAMPDPNVVAISARGGATKKNMHFPAKRIRKVELWVVLTKGPFSCSPTRPFDLSVPTNIVLRDILQSSLGSSAAGSLIAKCSQSLLCGFKKGNWYMVLLSCGAGFALK